MIIKRNGQNIDLDGLTRVELLELKLDLGQDINSIKSQVERARVNLIKRGEYADPDWYQRALTACKIKQNQVQRIQIELGKRKRNQTGKFENAFIDLARQLLHQDTFDLLMDQARSSVEENR